MSSSQKKRVREQSAAARRDRAAKKRADKSAASNKAIGPLEGVHVRVPAQIPAEALTLERVV